MSYNEQDAFSEEERDIAEALKSGSEELLRFCAHRLAERDPERALKLLEAANKAAQGDWAFDEARDNQEI